MNANALLRQMAKNAETLEGLRVFLIEDEEFVRSYVRTVLEREGCFVKEFSNGKEAMEHFSTGDCDLVITDIVMPEKDGIETIIEIRNLFPPVSVIAMSGDTENEKLLRLSNAFQADATLKKPFDKKRLVKAVKRVKKRQ